MLILVDAIAKIENSPEFATNGGRNSRNGPTSSSPTRSIPATSSPPTISSARSTTAPTSPSRRSRRLGAYAQLAQCAATPPPPTASRAPPRSDVTHWMSVSIGRQSLRPGLQQPQHVEREVQPRLGQDPRPESFPGVRRSDTKWLTTKSIKTYGVPVESTTKTAKTDWELWSASLATNSADFETLIAPIYNYMNTDRQPPADAGLVRRHQRQQRRVQARAAVIGGVFIKMLTDFSMWQKYASQDHTVLTGWAGLPVATPVMPNALTSPQSWKYTTATPTSDWTNASFDDTTWSTGTGGFGTAGTPGAIVNTNWNTSDIYLRKSFTMPSGSFSNLEIQAYHDEDAQVYINGILAASATGYDTTYDFLDISPAALAQLTPGATVEFAVHCHQTVGGQDIDVGLVNLVAASSPSVSAVALKAPLVSAPLSSNSLFSGRSVSLANRNLLLDQWFTAGYGAALLGV